MDISYIWVIGHLAFFLTAVSFLLKDIILLRGIAVVSSIVGISYNYFSVSGPNWLPIFWLSIFAIINAFRIIGILREKLSINFSEEEKELFETVFSNFNAVEYMKLFRTAEWKNIPAGTTIAREGEQLDGVYMLYNGEVSVERSGTEIGTSRDGALIGEMSFIKGGEYAGISISCFNQTLQMRILAKSGIESPASQEPVNRCRSKSRIQR